MQWSILTFISIIWLLQLQLCTFLCGPKQDKCVSTLVPLNLQLILITKTQNRMQRRDLNVQTEKFLVVSALCFCFCCCLLLL